MTTWQRCLVLYIYLSSCHETVGARIFDTSRGYDASSVSTWRLARKTLLSSNELIRLRQSSPSGSQSSLSRQMLRSSLAWLGFASTFTGQPVANVTPADRSSLYPLQTLGRSAWTMNVITAVNDFVISANADSNLNSSSLIPT